MDGHCFRVWSWIPIVILSGCFVASNQVDPCTSDLRYFRRSGTEVTVFLREQCDRELNITEIQQSFDRSMFDTEITVMATSLTCETQTRGLDALLRVFGERKQKTVIAALDSPMCDIAIKLAHLWNVPLFTWTCPLKDLREHVPSSMVVRLTPSLPTIAKALAEMFSHLQWKSAAVIATDREPWLSFYGAVLNAFRSVGIVLRYRVVLPQRATIEEIRTLLRPVHAVPRKATILCLPMIDSDEMTSPVLLELDTARQSPNSATNSIILLIHAKDDDLFLPRSDASLVSTLDTPTFVPLQSSMSSNFSTFNVSDDVISFPDNDDEEPERQQLGENRPKFLPPKNLSSVTLDRLLALTPLDQRYNVEMVFDGRMEFVEPTLLDRLNETLAVLAHDNSSVDAFNNNKMYTYVLLDWRANAWKPIAVATEQQESRMLVRTLARNAFAIRDTEVPEFSEFSECELDLDTDQRADCLARSSERTAFRVTHIVAVVLGSLLLTLVAVVLVILLRKRLVKRRMSKGPYKILLTTSDFVFPQVPQVDSRRVDEGIERMLCCWLQQLQEFGGPEVEKPDLLQLGSVSSLRPYFRTSAGNLPRHTFFKDPRARYNGDLVQLKELPSQGAFELKNKAMDVLVSIHGLRHENLNPLIGCLNEPTRPCLVYEYCSRGSLEDVLVQDEIKLDWSFRLSLLTDLVRGMRYIHGTPIRVHGYLTSRNCVIDARWVLKVTDYGLPSFYETQNIVPPAKTARDLLWTAPELLRHPNLRKKGTQPGDVYSFGIIMQEVVVRGEPFCMLALSPEDIIEKVMKPPPLIRPSVSKGAAPPEAINIMRQCWAEAADMRPHFDDVHDLFKKLNHGRKVNFVDTMFQMLEKYSNNLEELIRERTEQLDMEKKKTEQLLNRMLPSTVAEKLKLGMPVDPEEFREVTICFSDIVGFTSISAHSTPFQVVDLLNDLYTCFDATINAYTVYKVETIGDAYMVVGGCPVRIPDHASQIATMALDLLHQSGKFKLKHLPQMPIRLRIGLHTGPCCAGVVGLTMPRYCLFGDTVNTASRMESTGAPWRIHLSQATRDRLMQVGGYRIEYRGDTEVKGKGKMPTYWLLGKQGFEKELPTPPLLGENHGLNESIIVESFSNEEARPVESTGSAVSPDKRILRASQTIENEEIVEAKGGNTDGNGDGDTGRDRNGDGDGDGNVDGYKDGNEKKESNDKGNVKITTDSNKSKITVSVHEDKAVELGKRTSSSPIENAKIEDSTKTQSVRKSSSGETQSFLGNAGMAGLATSTTSLSSISSSTALPYRAVPPRHRRVPGTPGYVEENDLSTPYNHYRCLSPNEHHGRGTGFRLLKRQFSLDRPDEPTAALFTISDQQQQQQQHLRTTGRLYKQNSAGAANDLERIEEVPPTPSSGPSPGPSPGQRALLQNYRHAASVSLSVESLTLR